MTSHELARCLRDLGHAPEWEGSEIAWLRPNTPSLQVVIGRYQSFHQLPITGALDPATEEHLSRPRCAHPDVLAVSAGESAWSVLALTWWQQIAYPSIDPALIAAEYGEAWRRMTAVCGLTASPAASASAANVQAVQGPIDGPWNVLALSELPPPQAAPSTVLHQTFDVAETGLTSAQRVAMMAHEIGHVLGLGHATPGSGNLMEPVLGTIDHPQAGDTAALVERYGPPTTSGAPPAEPPAPALATVSTITLTMPNGDKVALDLGIAVLSAALTPVKP